MPFNRSMEGGYGGVFGTLFVCGCGEENFISLTPEQMEKYQKAEILVGFRENEPVTLKVDAKPKLRQEKAVKHDEIQR